jgi:DNA-binding MarR family transcriptional regulator
MEQDIEKLISLFIQLKKTFIESERSEGTIDKKVGTYLQAHVLFFLDKHPGATLTEIANHACGTPSSTTQLIERLHKAKLVNREADEKDRRITRHSLTKKGLITIEEIKKEKKAQAKKIFSKLEENDLKSLVIILEKLLHNLNTK